MLRSHFCFCIYCSLLGLIFALLMLFGAPAAAVAQQKVSFIKDVAPILKENCFACHDSKKKKGKLDMSSYGTFRKGGKQGDPITPGMHDASVLWFLITDKGKTRMPPPDAGDALSKKKIEIITAWINQGAKIDGGLKESENIRHALRMRWQPPNPPTAYKYPVHVNAMIFTPNNKQLVVGGYHELTVWDVEKAKLAKRIFIREERTYAMEFLPDGNLVTAGGRPGQEGKVRVYNINASSSKKIGGVSVLDGVNDSKVFLKELLDSNDVLLTLATSKNGKRLASAGCDRLVRIWNLDKGFRNAKLDQEIENHADWVFSIAFSPNGDRLFTASRDKTAKIWDLNAKESVATFPSHQDIVYGVTISHDDKTAFSVGQDSNVRYWRADTKDKNIGKQLRAAGSHTSGVFKIARHPDARKNWILTCSADKTVRVWNMSNGKLEKTLTGHSDWIYALAVSPNGEFVAAGSWNGEVRIWNLNSGKLATRFNASPGFRSAKKTTSAK